MKSAPKAERREKGAAGQGKASDERKEGLVLLAIAILFVANVVLYLCHHYGLTSLNDGAPRVELMTGKGA